MANGGLQGTVAGLWRFPVKSMRGEQLAQATVTKHGIAGDRAYALIDTKAGEVVSAKSVKRFPGLLECKAVFIEPPRADGNLPPVQILLPDGTSVRSDSEDVNGVLSAHFKRNVTLSLTVPGSKAPIPVGPFFDAFPLSVLTTSTLAQLSEHRPQSRFDPRRFRMNMIVYTEQSGFIENGWIGHELEIGNSLRLKVALPDPRCVMTTLAQDDLPLDIGILRTMVRHNTIQIGELGKLPCAGVYTEVAASGTVEIGDPVLLK